MIALRSQNQDTRSLKDSITSWIRSTHLDSISESVLKGLNISILSDASVPRIFEPKKVKIKKSVS